MDCVESYRGYWYKNWWNGYRNMCVDITPWRGLGPCHVVASLYMTLITKHGPLTRRLTRHNLVDSIKSSSQSFLPGWGEFIHLWRVIEKWPGLEYRICINERQQTQERGAVRKSPLGRLTNGHIDWQVLPHMLLFMLPQIRRSYTFLVRIYHWFYNSFPNIHTSTLAYMGFPYREVKSAYICTAK